MAVYRHYFGLFRPLDLALFLLPCTAFGFLYNFSTVWLKFWSDHNVEHPNESIRRKGFYLGIFTLIQLLALVMFAFFVCYKSIKMAFKSGRILHSRALSTVMAAPLSFFSGTDNGSTVNRFSQDMTIIDGELSFGISNTALTIAAASGQAVVLAVASPYIAISYPFLILLLYGIQKVYLRTSRQLRFLDLEAKAPLYTKLLETVDGLASLRAFGWVDQYITQNEELVDNSQKPLYMLAMMQQWLKTVLDWLIAAMATLLVVLATQLTNRSSAGLISIGWTQVEIAIGAVSRLKSFGEDVRNEDLPGEDFQPHTEWPEHGMLEIANVSASYSESNASDHLALHDVSISIGAGEKVAIVGRTGSGKSSLVLLILRLLDPLPSSTSRIILDGVNLQAIRRQTLRERVITIPQDSFLHDHLTWQQNLHPGDGSTIEDCASVLEDVNLLEDIRVAGGIQAIAKPDILSHGQKQLFNLARAVLKGRQRAKVACKSNSHSHLATYVESSKQAACGSGGGLLILDEISSSVDEVTEATMHAIIMREFAAYTIIAIAHRMDSVKGFDTVVVMEDGKVKERGKAGDILPKLEANVSNVA